MAPLSFRRGVGGEDEVRNKNYSPPVERCPEEQLRGKK
jgi:hypothetical protein